MTNKSGNCDKVYQAMK